LPRYEPVLLLELDDELDELDELEELLDDELDELLDWLIPRCGRTSSTLPSAVTVSRAVPISRVPDADILPPAAA